ncbi:molybdate ABC transporter substrate-binding protein [Pseudocolwellia agarivorans]|uniref:molybdate ABC transporter substrate-binding protein n=1 Tax=Pseudocolwellia agarivorans TaxID=1911682 RepID=UPI0009860726|nr:molybdate ABC transporter substrate-binding protein [Pseudocolwellia agarivorans]
MSKWLRTLYKSTLCMSIFICFFTTTSSYAKSKPLRVAVSSNFAPVLTQLAPTIFNETNITIDIISGSSGTLYQQIIHGAPYDMFLSADDIHPQRLASESFTVKNSLQTYAIGQLAFWSANKNFNPQQNLTNLLNEYLVNSSKIAISNPNTAPYGQRAVETLNALGFWEKFKDKTITGINVNQTFQQIRSHAVTAGFVALSQLKLNNLHGIVVPEDLYSPIKQQLVILKNSKRIEAAEKLALFIQTSAIQKIIASYGYKAASL